VNLRAGDIANMGFAQAADVPVVLVGDIDRGGVIAQLVGTHAVLDAGDLAMVRGFLINKFRGDPTLFDDGYRLIAVRTGWRGFGVLPWFPDAGRLPAEDVLDLGHGTSGGAVTVAVLGFSRIANFDDLDPLRLEPGLSVRIVRAGEAIPGDAALVILPGSKSTRADLEFLRAQGWDVDLRAHLRRGGRVLGLCGGYQMLGRSIQDRDGIEGQPGEVEGLGLLDVSTVMTPDKRLTRTAAVHVATGLPVEGYEIHIGRTTGADSARPFARIGPACDGATSADGRVEGTYLHGLFASDEFRTAFLGQLGIRAAGHAHGAEVEATLDRLAGHIEAHLDVAGLLGLAR
jgi:adenosylcobyric acid synthase